MDKWVTGRSARTHTHLHTEGSVADGLLGETGRRRQVRELTAERERESGVGWAENGLSLTESFLLQEGLSDISRMCRDSEGDAGCPLCIILKSLIRTNQMGPQ
jgi:hypothetical protein